jgi:uncharacterized repeat protein (TIGR03803 family)
MPFAPLLAVGNDFYGTTTNGGQFGWGTVFRVSRTGDFTVLYSFLGLGDGAQPQRLVLGPDSAVYGTTTEVARGAGQTPIHGTFFRIAPSGALATLYVFRQQADGYAPGWLTLGNDGYFYGVTARGGTLPTTLPIPSGTAFRVNTQGRLQVVHVFSDSDKINVSSNGQNSLGPLVQGADGNLYVSDGWGIVRLTLSGGVSRVGSVGNDVLPFFVAGRDGRIYGSAINGFPCDNGNVFSFSPAGDIRLGPEVKSPDLDVCGGFLLDFQAADLSLFGRFNTRVVRVTPQGGVPDPAAYPKLPGPRLTDGGDGWIYGITSGDRVADFGSVFKMSILGMPKPPTNVRITPG